VSAVWCADDCGVWTEGGGEEGGYGGVVGGVEGGCELRTVSSGVDEGDEVGGGVRDDGLCVSGPYESAAYDCYVELCGRGGGGRHGVCCGVSILFTSLGTLEGSDKSLGENT